jgi:TatD DNase family protein
LIFIDSHCHLNLIKEGLGDVIDRAIDANITKIIVPGINLETSQKAIEIAEIYPPVYAAVGIHPNEAGNTNPGDIEVIKNLALHSKVVAIGEIGLDYHYPPFDMLLQKNVLTTMLDLALQVEKPVILHSRDSLSDLLEIVTNYRYAKQNHLGTKPLCGVFHMFEGNCHEAIPVTKMGFFISIGGNITFKNNQKGKENVEKLELESLLLETDSPFISPHPYRGIPNEPARIPTIAAKVAEIRQTQVELVAEVTTRNAMSLFKLD